MTNRGIEDIKLSEQIKVIFNESRQTYGHRRVKKFLKRCGIKCSNDRIRRLMKQMNLVPVHRKRFKATTNSNHSLPVAPNLLKRNFLADKPRHILVGDITYISTDEGWLYLAAVVDLFSRRVVGWALGSRMTKELVIKAMKQTLHHEQLEEGAIFHSDRGSQYASYYYQALLKEHNILQSMSSKGDCYDNACTESFFATLKKELIYRRSFKTRSRAKIEVIDYILWYNSQRLHSYLDYCSPMEFEKIYFESLHPEAA